MRVLTLLLILSSLVGCSADWHLKRALKKNPDLLDTSSHYFFDTTIVTDSVVLTDTFYTKEYDTLVLHDSASGVTTQIIRIKDTLLVTTKVTPDTIKITQQIAAKPRKTIFLKTPWYKNVFFWVSIVLLLLVWRLISSMK